jgi:hypothetical protein
MGLGLDDGDTLFRNQAGIRSRVQVLLKCCMGGVCMLAVPECTGWDALNSEQVRQVLRKLVTASVGLGCLLIDRVRCIGLHNAVVVNRALQRLLQFRIDRDASPDGLVVARDPVDQSVPNSVVGAHATSAQLVAVGHKLGETVPSVGSLRAVVARPARESAVGQTGGVG